MSYATAFKAETAAADLTPAGWPEGWDYPGPLPPGYDKFPGVTISSGTGVYDYATPPGTNTVEALGSIRATRINPSGTFSYANDDYMYFDGNVIDLTEYEYAEIPVDSALNFIDPQENTGDGTSQQKLRLSGVSADFDITDMTTVPSLSGTQDSADFGEVASIHDNSNYYLLQDVLLMDMPSLAAAYGIKMSVRSASTSGSPRGTYGFNWDGGSITLHPTGTNDVSVSDFGMITSATPTVFNASTKIDITSARYFIMKFASTVTNYAAHRAMRCPISNGTSIAFAGKVYAKWITSAIDTSTISWNNQPTLGSAFELFQNFSAGDYIPLPTDPSADIFGMMIYVDSTMNVDVNSSDLRLV